MQNPYACGHAWFVKHYTVMPDADAELKALGNLNPKDSAVVVKDHAGALQNFVIQPDSAAQIRLSSYHPDKMAYTYSAATEQLAVFPEIYYPPSKGWKCFINDQPAPDFFKVNYVLRGMRLPAGQDMKLEMRFEPRSFFVGETVSKIASALILLLFIAGLVLWFKRHALDDPNRLQDMPAPEKSKRAESNISKSKTAKPKGRRK